MKTLLFAVTFLVVAGGVAAIFPRAPQPITASLPVSVETSTR